MPSVTDDQIANKIGRHLYMPSYLTDVVGHGMAAPAYMSALISLCTAVFVFRVLGAVEPCRVSITTMPMSVTGTKGLRTLLPLSGLAVLELLAQVRWPSCPHHLRHSVPQQLLAEACSLRRAR